MTPDSPEQFNRRPIDIFMCFGYSSESRPRMMGELLKQAGRFCAHWCLCEDDLRRALRDKQERIFALLHIPHYRRIHISQLIEWQGQSKVSLSLNGHSAKCFRDAEASYNSVMARQGASKSSWSYPWIGGVNCIDLPNGESGEINSIAAAETLWQYLRVNQGSLYPLYVRGMENNQRYHNTAYARDYLLPKILGALK